ncbi:hypothetical protein [Leptolyngbya sp. FACHB-261]|uniref:hypothetical protein n=1 Tax=Leptolyngbya sp. FACHB-261 TaxID=2692806 RepID=UPI0016836591|nr:hypothetical protein [Leptolyngbya sp. FACHB-261]MBD2099781.1 hypothetical protein [Leptolyngbya sp. FACHB-261]
MSNTLLQRIQQHQNLRDLRNKLLALHKVLLESERISYEQARGRVTGGELLQLVLEHEQFAWLRRISDLIVRIDEMLHGDEPIAPGEAQDVVTYARELLVPSETGNAFARRYYQALQDEPGVVMAHAEVTRLLQASDQ